LQQSNKVGRKCPLGSGSMPDLQSPPGTGAQHLRSTVLESSQKRTSVRRRLGIACTPTASFSFRKNKDINEPQLI
jgi:hypothetical protein